MSLRVWLPLTKDLRQQGLDSTTVTQNSGTAISSGGKLGSCLTATSNATVVVNLPSLATMLANGKSYSLACWVKVTNNVTNGWVIKLGTNSCGLWWAASEARWVWNENDNGKRCANPTISSDTANWHHLVTTITKSSDGSTTTARHYVDGKPATSYEVQTWDGSGNTQPTGTTITIYPYVASLNDVRLYNHCLSENEIKRLAQGLIIHYPLNRQGLGQDNLLIISNAKATSGYQVSNFACAANVSVSEWGCTDAYRCTGSGGTSTIIGTIGIGRISDSNLKYSYSVWVKNNHSTNSIAFYPNHNGNYSSGWLAPGQSKRLLVEGAPGNNSSYIQLNWRTNTAGDAFDFTYWHPKIEIGDKVTTWSQSKYDSIFEILTYDKALYVEPDGTQWIRIAHHNNPGNAQFASSDNFVGGVYKDANRWYQVEKACNFISSNEFLVKQKNASDSTEVKYRWKQTKSLLTATYNDVAPTAVTRIITTGYTDGSYGGLYIKGGNARLCIADGTDGDWWGAIGCWTTYQSGLPGYPKQVVTTGYIDLYIRIDNVSLGGTEYDISGNCYNATRISTYIHSSDTPKYMVSSVFDGATSATVPAVYGSTDRHKQLTIATWIKRTSNDANYHYYWYSTAVKVFLRSYQNVDNYYGLGWNHATADSVAGEHGWVTSVIPLNTWVHSVWVFDSGIWKHYINGILESTRNDSSYGEYICGDIGGSQNLGRSWTGSLSDFRIYATALSADEVFELYHNF